MNQQKNKTHHLNDDARYMNVVINFPLCIKTEVDDYYRYHNDGRFESFKVTRHTIGLTFGRLEPEFIASEHTYLKIIMQRHTIITELEFCDAFNKYCVESYAQYEQGVFNEHQNELQDVFYENFQGIITRNDSTIVPF